MHQRCEVTPAYFLRISLKRYVLKLSQLVIGIGSHRMNDAVAVLTERMNTDSWIKHLLE